MTAAMSAPRRAGCAFTAAGESAALSPGRSRLSSPRNRADVMPVTYVAGPQTLSPGTWVMEFADEHAPHSSGLGRSRPWLRRIGTDRPGPRARAGRKSVRPCGVLHDETGPVRR